MRELDYEEILGDEIEVVEVDKLSKEPVIWGRRVLIRLTQQDFDHLKLQNDVVGVMEMEMVYFVVTKRFDWEQLKKKHGEPIQVGTGPRDGFKWVKMTDGTCWNHSMYRDEAKLWLRFYPRFRVKCNKNGDSLRPSRMTTGRTSANRNRRKR